jgi:hypothetical protein
LKTNITEEKIMTIQSKIIGFSLQIQQKINTVVEKQVLLMKKQNGIPFLENSCCNERNAKVRTAILYFENKDTSIRQHNLIVSNLSSILSMIHSKTEANTLYCNINTKNIYPPISTDYSEETIYFAFIQFCHFKSVKPIQQDLFPVCKKKPETVKETDNLITIIGKLKTERIEYNIDNFNQLLELVHRKNKIQISTDESLSIFTKGKEHRFVDLLNSLEDEKEKEKEFEERIKNLLQKESKSKKSTAEADPEANAEAEAEVEEAKEEVLNYLIQSNEKMTKKIEESIQGVEITGRAKEKVLVALQQLEEWEQTDKSIIYRFFQTSIQNFTNIFPMMLIKNHSLSVVIPSYIGLSRTDEIKMETYIEEQFSELQSIFPSNTNMIELLKQIQKKTNIFYSLSKETPSWEPLQISGDQKIEIGIKLFKYYFLRVLTYYIEEFYNNNLEKNIKTAAKNYVGKLLVIYLQIMQQEKKKIDISYKNVQDEIFRINKFEKKRMTDRLRNMSDDARKVDNEKKFHKLGEWAVGQKSDFGVYNPNESNDLAEALQVMEQLRANKNNGMTGEELDNLDDARENIAMDEDDYSFNNTRQFRENPNDDDDGEIDYDMGDDTDYDVE